MSETTDDDGKPDMPQVLKDLGSKAIKRLERRSATPEIEVVSEGDSWTFRSPYRAADLDEWEALLFEAFATRSIGAFHVFTSQLARLCSTDWHADGSGWMPNRWELRASIQIVRSLKPRNEAEACLAAQMVAVHFMQMKLSAEALKRSWPDPRSCAIAGKLARTYAMQLETMAKLRGKGARQRITVRKYSQHEHKHIHLHQGDSENGNQPHEPKRTRRNMQDAPVELEGRPALSGQDETSHALPIPRLERSEALPSARRRQRQRSSRR